jgi:hypothetical protein
MSNQNIPRPNKQNQRGQESIKEGRNVPLPNPNQGQVSGQGNGSSETITTKKNKR